MYGQTSFHDSKNSAAPKGITALLLGVIVCYQVVNHIFLHQTVSHEDEDLESDAACAAVPGASGYSCMEAKLFKGWHELPTESATELDQLLVVSPSTSSEQPLPSTSAAPSAPVTKGSSGTQALRGDAKPETRIGNAAVPKDGEQDEAQTDKALEGLLWDLAWNMGHGDKSHSAPDKNRKPKPTPKPSAFMAKKSKQAPKKKSFAKGLTDLQQKLEAKMQSQARRHAEHRKMRALSVAARGHSHESTNDPMTPWAHNLDELTHELQHGLHAWRKERTEHAAAHAAKTGKAKAKYDPMTPWAHNLDDLTHEMQDHMEARNKERAEHAAAHAARHKASTESSPFMDEIDALGRELCQDPSRRDRPACAQFMHPHHSGSHAEERKARRDAHDNAIAHIKLLEKHLEELEKDREHDNEEIRAESTQFLKELCADPARHSYPTCAQFLTGPSSAPAKAGSNMRGSTAKPAATDSKKVASSALSHLHWVAMTDSEEAARSKHIQHMGASTGQKLALHNLAVLQSSCRILKLITLLGKNLA